jgi:hypothetical protein
MQQQRPQERQNPQQQQQPFPMAPNGESHGCMVAWLHCCMVAWSYYLTTSDCRYVYTFSVDCCMSDTRQRVSVQPRWIGHMQPLRPPIRAAGR